MFFFPWSTCLKSSQIMMSGSNEMQIAEVERSFLEYIPNMRWIIHEMQMAREQIPPPGRNPLRMALSLLKTTFQLAMNYSWDANTPEQIPSPG